MTTRALIAICGLGAGLVASARAQDAEPAQPTPATPGVRGGRAQSLEPYEGRPIRRIVLRQPRPAGPAPEGPAPDEPEATEFVPLDPALLGLTLNTLRSTEGAPFRAAAVEEDISRLNRVGRYRRVDSRVQLLDDGSVELVFTVVPQPVVRDVQAVGNKLLSDEEIDKLVEAIVNTPLDRYQLEQASRRIKNLYRSKGYYLAEVTVDEAELESSGIVYFRIREGERIKVSQIRFEGNRSFSAGELQSQIKTRVAWLFDKGPVDDEVLDADVASLVSFYRDRGYLDVRADRLTQTSPDGREAVVSFLVDEGPVYTLRRLDLFIDDRARVFPTLDEARGAAEPGDHILSRAPNEHLVYKDGVFTTEQVLGLMEIKPGDVYGVEKLRTSIDAVLKAYGKLGHSDVRVTRRERRDTESPQVDLLLAVHEGSRFRTGEVIIRGNELTKQEVILHEVMVKPDRPLDSTAVEETRRRLDRLRLFDSTIKPVKVTVQEPDPEDAEFRDVLVEVAETNTGSITFGIAVGSDSGIIGQFRVNQRNFDIADTPDSLGEFIAGRAFRGGGQNFTIDVQPGTEIQNYSISLSDPTLLDTDYMGSATGYYRVREYDQYDEDRLGTRFAIGRKFGEFWSASVPVRVENVHIRDIDADAPDDVFAVQGDNPITSLGFSLSRVTFNDTIRPTKGSRFEVGVEQIGAFGGDWTFTAMHAEHGVYITVNEDFLGRKSVLSFKSRVAYIPQNTDDVPTFERFYLGGQTFRGFRFRAISPIGIRHDTGEPGDDPVGGTWLFFTGAEFTQPVIGETLAIAAFVDTGTVQDTVGFDEYRVSAGVGFRLYFPGISPVPLAFDFGFPIVSQDTDRERVFSFTLDLPFN